MTQDIACFTPFAPCSTTNGNGKWIVGVVFSRSHGQANDQGGPGVKNPGRKDKEGMHIAHFPSYLGIAVNPDDVLPPWRP